MEFRFSEEDEVFRSEIIKFVESELPWDWKTQELDPEEPEDLKLVQQFKQKLAKKGWLTRAWPEEYGGQNASHIQQLIFNEEMAYRGVPVDDGGISMVGPIIMMSGTEQQKQYFLPRIARAEINWCQGYSEPDAGSDLASVQTKAEEDGDDFVVNGSKIWNGAHSGADWMFMLVRTDPDVRKHRGISFLVAEMNTPGITIERIPLMWGADRSLVTFSEARVPKTGLIGEKNMGWYVGATLLDLERSGVGYCARATRLLEDLTEFCKQSIRDGEPISQNPLVKTRLSQMAVDIEICKVIAYQVAWMQSQGQIPNKEASISKLQGSEMLKKLYGLGIQILGMFGQLEPDSKWVPMRGRFETGYMSVGGNTVAAGTSEIQRNIIATRGLGLPRG
ncbi:MAG: acyl-CoA dehydrogenase family protein [Chloroflexota bacterium]|nr:acyl-CoA dehydrogenase family protein [Chloroflexota bacterium]